MADKYQDLVIFGERVKAVRKNQGLSQEELAAKADLHRTYIGMIERGEKNITLLKIHEYLAPIHPNRLACSLQIIQFCLV